MGLLSMIAGFNPTVILAGAAAALVVGAAGAEIYEHKLDITVPLVGWKIQGLGPKLETTRAALVQKTADYDALKANRQLWVDAQKKDLELILTLRKNGDEAVNRASAAVTSAQGDAFNKGYAAGRVVGRNSCGATDANPIPGPGGQPAADGVRGDDLAAIWSAKAYRPAAAPGQ